MPERGDRAIEVQLIADLACPWCHIGLARLNRARAARPDLPVRVRWWPFMLNPQLPPDGMDRAAYVRLKFGGEAAARQVYDRIREAGRQDGIEFAFERMTRTPSTLAAHRLILHGEEKGRGEPLIVELFKALLERGEDIGQLERLVEIAATAGLEPPEVAEFLEGRERAGDVVAAHQRAEKLGVRGVPVFVVGGRHVISGAQPPEILTGLLDLAAAAPAKSEATSR
jgi:predicted DsbA family dithiol-disulfide isomerase